MISMIIGQGEIGKAVRDVIEPFDIVNTYDKKYAGKPLAGNIPLDIIHICFPYSAEFVDQVRHYVEHYDPKYVIVWSSVPIGTCRLIDVSIIHSPVEGQHPGLAQSIRAMRRWIGANELRTGTYIENYFLGMGLKTKLLNDSSHTEALKLLSTTEYGINIEFARYKRQIADTVKMNYNLTKEWNQDYNELYQQLGKRQYQKFILDAPDGPKGGHCVTPNARLLHEQFPNELVKIVGEIE